MVEFTDGIPEQTTTPPGWSQRLKVALARAKDRDLGWAWTYRWLVPLNLFLLAPALYSVQSTGGDPVTVWNLATSVLWLATFQLLARRPVRFFVLATPFVLVVLVELFLIVEYDTRLTTSFLSVIVENVWDTPDFLAAYSMTLLGAGLVFGGTFGYSLYRLRTLELPARRAWALVPLALVLGLYGAVAARQMRTGMSADRALLDVVTHDMNSPFGVVPQGLITFQLYREEAELFAESRTFTFGATRAPVRAPEVYVLVIGETSRPDHWALNGYGRDTSPRLSRQSNFVTFPDLITQSPSTSQAVPLMITRATADDYVLAAREKSIITAFKEVGFKTYWFTPQEVSHWGGFIHHYAAETDVRRYFDRRHDGAMLEPFEEVLDGVTGPDDKVFFVFHTMGSHFAFENRYPPEFRHFSAQRAASKREHLVDTYDDSIRYTDHFLAEVIARLQARPDVRSAMMFVSDHGENLLDDERQLFGHAMGTKFDLPTAGFFWYSDALAASRPEAVENVRRNAPRRLSTANVFHSLADLGRIEADEVDLAKSVFSATLEDGRRLFTCRGRIADYDALFAPDVAATAAGLTPR